MIKNARKAWTKTLARRGTKGRPQSSRTASKLGGIRKPSKYHAEKTTVDNIVFDSKKEARRYGELKLLAKAGEIGALACQPVFQLMVPDQRTGITIRIGEYRGDFKYQITREDADVPFLRWVVEDVKGFKTPLYRWKKKHVEAQYGIVIREL